MINQDDFKKIDLRVGRVVEVKEIEKSDKLLVLKVDIGEETRQVLAGIGRDYKPNEIIGRDVVVIINLEPKEMFGLKSEGMLLAAKSEGKPIILTTEREALPGSIII